MTCPRCGCSTPADRGACPECQWTLSRPFARDGSLPDDTETGFSLPRPFQPGLWAEKINGALRRRRRRPRRPAVSGGVATLPEAAYYAAPPRVEYLAAPVYQPALDFPPEPELAAAHAVAPLSERARAWLIDASLILLAATAFFGLFALLGGALELTRRAFALYVLALFTLTSLYFALFTCLGGRTPGMQRVGLWVRDFDGRPPARRQLLARAFGLVISAGSLLVGFFWAAVDEQRLTWHDHISRTFLTDRPRV